MSERTLRLLTEGSRHAVNGTNAVPAAASVQCNGHDKPMPSLPSNQLRISCSGKLVLSSSCDSVQVKKEQTSHNDGNNQLHIYAL